jgi:hypothetical protein
MDITRRDARLPGGGTNHPTPTSTMKPLESIRQDIEDLRDLEGTIFDL